MRSGLIACALASTLLAGCANWVLPSESQSKATGFETYDKAQTTYNRVLPFQTTAGDLADMGIFPGKTSNLKVVTYLDIMQRFMPQQTVKISDLDPAVQACLNAREGCEGWILPLERTDKQRVGDVSLDMLGFRKETLSQGWNAEMVLLLTDDVVVYKLWSGAPSVTETRTETKPLGPLQDAGPAVGNAIKDAIAP
jgi:hypothetical protein